MPNQYTAKPSDSYGAKHIRMRKARGKARDHICVRCPKQAREWAQVHGTDGMDPWADYVPMCAKCHKHYDGIGSAVAESNRQRTGETRSGYTVSDKVRAANKARAIARWGGDAK